MLSIFCVTSSPIRPSPLVAADINTPSLYVKLSERPSILGSQI